jgi:hypothetical protein
MYFPRNGEFGPAVAKHQTVGGGVFEPPNPPARYATVYHKGICWMLWFLTINAAQTTVFLKVCCQTCIKISKVGHHFKTMILRTYKMTIISSIMCYNCVVQLRSLTCTNFNCICSIPLRTNYTRYNSRNFKCYFKLWIVVHNCCSRLKISSVILCTAKKNLAWLTSPGGLCIPG